jgi:hypothetical protein
VVIQGYFKPEKHLKVLAILKNLCKTPKDWCPLKNP